MPAELAAVLKSLWGCEKWILQKILHRYSYPKKISTFCFRWKKYFWKFGGNIFGKCENFQNKSTYRKNLNEHFQNHRRENFDFFFFETKFFFKFQNYFFRWKKVLIFFWITGSMWNFLKNPFFASSERFDKYFRMKSALKGKNHDFELNPPIFGWR